MKKMCVLVLAIVLVAGQSFAQESSKPSLKEVWSEFGKTAAEAGKTLGAAMAETGKKAANMTYFGTWVFTSGNTVTTIKINDDWAMEITQATPRETAFWKGTCSGAITSMTFKINESGRRVGSKVTSTADDKKWNINYSINEDDGLMKIKCANIPTTEDGHNFSNETTFVQQK